MRVLVICVSTLAVLLVVSPAHASYRIREGDTLTDIARRTDTSMDKLDRLNGIPNRDFIVAGRTLKLSGEPRDWEQPSPPAPSTKVAAVSQPTSTEPSLTVTYSVDWHAIADCESGGDWGIDTGNGYYGGLQFSLETWLAYGGEDYAYYPNNASVAAQIAIAERVLQGQGIGAWPTCGAYG